MKKLFLGLLLSCIAHSDLLTMFNEEDFDDLDDLQYFEFFGKRREVVEKQSEWEKASESIWLNTTSYESNKEKTDRLIAADQSFDTSLILLKNLSDKIDKLPLIMGHKQTNVLYKYAPLAYLAIFYKSAGVSFNMHRSTNPEYMAQTLKDLLSSLSTIEDKQRAIMAPIKGYSTKSLVRESVLHQGPNFLALLLADLTREQKEAVILESPVGEFSTLGLAALGGKLEHLRVILDAMKDNQIALKKGYLEMKPNENSNTLFAELIFGEIDPAISSKYFPEDAISVILGDNEMNGNIALDPQYFPIDLVWEYFIGNFKQGGEAERRLIKDSNLWFSASKTLSSFKICILLVAYSKKINIIKEKSMLSYAVRIKAKNELRELLNLLSDAGQVDDAITALDGEGRSALHWAAEMAHGGNGGYLKMLLGAIQSVPARNEALSLKDIFGKTLLNIYPDAENVLSQIEKVIINAEKSELEQKIDDLKNSLELLRAKLQRLNEGLNAITEQLGKPSA